MNYLWVNTENIWEKGFDGAQILKFQIIEDNFIHNFHFSFNLKILDVLIFLIDCDKGLCIPADSLYPVMVSS
jgi:hypothetical protein